MATATKEKNSLEELRKLFGFPAEKPDCEPSDFGWFDEANAREMPKIIPADAKVIVELGSLFGTSARFLADHSKATIVCIDHWQGGPYLRGPFWQPYLAAGLYETFLSTCWEYRDRLIPVRMWTADGMALLASYGVQVDMIYVDAGHHYEAVKADLAACLKFWPDAVLCGDDWTHPEDDGVERAVMELLPPAGYEVKVDAPFWSAIKSVKEKE